MVDAPTPLPVPFQFDRRLRAWLRLVGMTQTELAARVGVTKSAVNGWCKGIRYPDRVTLPKIIKSLRTTVEKFFGPIPRS